MAYLVHNTKDNLLVILETAGKLAPEGSELVSGGGGHIAGVTNDASGHWLLGGIVVSHVVVRIQDAVRSLGDGHVIHGSLKLIVVLGELLVPILLGSQEGSLRSH